MTWIDLHGYFRTGNKVINHRPLRGLDLQSAARFSSRLACPWRNVNYHLMTET